ncbi:MAG: sulfatase-like hydrolase/transferase, partial [Planctomycetota bacterium]
MGRQNVVWWCALLVFLAVSCSGESGGNGKIVREKRVALLNRTDLHAHMLPGGDRLRKVPREIGLMQRSCVVIPAGQRARFESVPIHAGARFTGYLGAVQPGPIGIELTVDRAPLPAQSFLAQAPGWVPFSIALGQFSGRQVALELRAAEGSAGDGLIVAEPAVLSEGQDVPVGDFGPLRVERLMVDLIKTFEQGRVARQDPERPMVKYSAVLDKERRTAADEAKEVIRAAPDSELLYDLDVPEGGYLEVTALNLRPAGQDPGDVEFQVLLAGQEVMRVCSDFVNLDEPDALPYDRLTHREEFDLSPFAGQKVELSLRTRRLKESTEPPAEYAWWDLKLLQRLDLPRRRASLDHPNVLVLCIDTLRADHLGCYGYPRNTSPNLDAFAENGILFENAISTCSWTLPATASLLTGLHPNTHGVLGNLRTYLVDAITTLPEYLRAFGVTTAAFSG